MRMGLVLPVFVNPTRYIIYKIDFMFSINHVAALAVFGEKFGSAIIRLFGISFPNPILAHKNLVDIISRIKKRNLFTLIY